MTDNRTVHIAPQYGRTLRVESGIRLLDKVMPGWEQKIDLRTLDLMSECSCILGQLYGTYMQGVTILDLKPGEPSRFGFFTTLDEPWDELTQYWKERIEELQSKAYNKEQDYGTRGR